MKAKLKPLKGIYYGTEIEITEGPLKNLYFKLWKSTGNPSDRELEGYNYTREQWNDNEMVDGGWGEKVPIQQLDITCDGHYESQEVYQLAKILIEFLNIVADEKLK